MTIFARVSADVAKCLFRCLHASQTMSKFDPDASLPYNKPRKNFGSVEKRLHKPMTMAENLLLDSPDDIDPRIQDIWISDLKEDNLKFELGNSLGILVSELTFSPRHLPVM
ncbi:putative aconitate hydratase, mitochondrial [Folsomia candida]|uniref:Putative aconitate hydratase, mitochondrial n=1 Tax=Folsomia candida TaxID=158441 RepID=A0A226EI78_FOLCA|nr:putative aconitate hydratase, mitochondrial [Folsomia candida]